MRKKIVKMRKARTNTGFKGISVHKATGKFETRVYVKGSDKVHSFYIGLYPTISAAVEARQEFITNLL